MQRQIFVALAVAGVCIVPGPASAQFASSVVSYHPGTGYQAGFTSASSALGEPARITPGLYGGPVDPFNPPYLSSQVVSLGAGGSLTVQFNEPIQNSPAHPFGLDFNVFGNSGFIVTNELDLTTFTWISTPRTDGSLFGADATATRVSVSADGVNFFTLNPLLAPTVDGLFPTDGSGDFGLPVSPALNASSFAGQDLLGIRSLYNGSGGGRGFDISWAQDSSGHSVALPSVSFVRVEVLTGNAEIDGFVAVPEPTVVALGALALGVLGYPRRKNH